jgi:hypothetical protein
MRKEWRFYKIFYFVCQTFYCKDMTPHFSLRKTRLLQNRQLYTNFTSQIRPEILI